MQANIGLWRVMLNWIADGILSIELKFVLCFFFPLTFLYNFPIPSLVKANQTVRSPEMEIAGYWLKHKLFWCILAIQGNIGTNFAFTERPWSFLSEGD